MNQKFIIAHKAGKEIHIHIYTHIHTKINTRKAQVITTTKNANYRNKNPY